MNIRSAIVSFLSFLWNISNTAGCPLKTSYFLWNWSFAMFFMIIAEQSQRYAGRIFSALATRWKKKAARTKEEPDSLSLSFSFSSLLSSRISEKGRWMKEKRARERGRSKAILNEEALSSRCQLHSLPSLDFPNLPPLFLVSTLYTFRRYTLSRRKYLNDTILRLLLPTPRHGYTRRIVSVSSTRQPFL